MGAIEDLDREASFGLGDPMALRQSLREMHTQVDHNTFRKMHDHPGMHPYRIVLAEVRGWRRWGRKGLRQRGTVISWLCTATRLCSLTGQSKGAERLSFALSKYPLYV